MTSSPWRGWLVLAALRVHNPLGQPVDHLCLADQSNWVIPCLLFSFEQWQVYGDKDVDGFYRGETCARLGLIPCNMVSEIQADDEEMMDQLLKQGFLPLNTPVEKLGKRTHHLKQSNSYLYGLS